MKLVMPGNNFNQRGWVQLPSDICRTIIGGGDEVDTTLETSRKCW